MTDKWINRRLLTQADGIYDESGARVLNLNYCDGSEVDATKYPVLASKLLQIESLDPLDPSTYPQRTTQCVMYTESTEFNDHLDQSQPTWEEKYGDYSLEHPDQFASTLGEATLPSVVIPIKELLTPPYSRALFEIYSLNTSATSFFTMKYLTSSGSEVYKAEYSVSSANVAELITYIGGVSQGVKISGIRNLYHILHFTDSGMSGITPYTGELEWSDDVDLSEVTDVAVSGGVDGSTTYWAGAYVRSIAKYVTLPDMSTPIGSINPYKIISDLYWEQIGDIIQSNDDKLIGASGSEEFDLLLCDGSVLDAEVYPQLAEKLPPVEEITEVGTLTASDAGSSDYFGQSCAIYGDRLVVGADGEDTGAANGGKVYIYDWNGTSYVEVGTLTASNAGSDDRFGRSCAIYEDRLVVGADAEDTAGSNAGKVYIYDWNGTSYDEVGTLTASDAGDGDYFGISCAVYEDRLVVGAPYADTNGANKGTAYIYDWNGTSYDQVGTLTDSDAQVDGGFGISCAVYGDRLVVGAHKEDSAADEGGKVYIYDWDGTSYAAVTTLTASDAEDSDRFGISCSIYGDRSAVGAFLEDTSAADGGKVYYYVSSDVYLLPEVDPQTVPPTKIVADLT